ncbi:hypothetical protein AgCh_016867 [Apium graveolens]
MRCFNRVVEEAVAAATVMKMVGVAMAVVMAMVAAAVVEVVISVESMGIFREIEIIMVVVVGVMETEISNNIVSYLEKWIG